MKNKVMLILALLNSSVWAVGVRPEGVVSNNTSRGVASIAPISLSGSGRLVIVDLNSKLIMVNNQSYKLARDVKIYDGKLESKKFIRFLLSPQKEVTEIWVAK